MIVTAVYPSFQSKTVNFFLELFGMKRAMERKILSNSYNKKPATIPKSIYKSLNIKVEEVNARKVWTISPKNTESRTVILFLHGGAYFANITPMHWQLVAQIVKSTHATCIVPDYPLAPESTCVDTYNFLDSVYAKLVATHHSKQIVFMGDSAGGGLALGYAQKVRSEATPQPQHIILFSPWFDASMSNPDITKLDRHDKILSVNGLKVAGQKYARKLAVTDYRVSPIYGDFVNLGKITIFIGTNEVLVTDARKLKQMLDMQRIELNYFEYNGLFHDWVVVPSLRESKDVIDKLHCINNERNRPTN